MNAIILQLGNLDTDRLVSIWIKIMDHDHGRWLPTTFLACLCQDLYRQADFQPMTAFLPYLISALFQHDLCFLSIYPSPMDFFPLISTFSRLLHFNRCLDLQNGQVMMDGLAAIRNKLVAIVINIAIGIISTTTTLIQLLMSKNFNPNHNHSPIYPVLSSFPFYLDGCIDSKSFLNYVNHTKNHDQRSKERVADKRSNSVTTTAKSNTSLPRPNLALGKFQSSESISTSTKSSSSTPSSPRLLKFKYFVNQNLIQQVVFLPVDSTIHQLSEHISMSTKNGENTYLVFTLSDDAPQLQVMSDECPLSCEEIYYAVKSSKVDSVCKKLKKRAKKNQPLAMSSGPLIAEDSTHVNRLHLKHYSPHGHRNVLSSESNELLVDFIPDSNIFGGNGGRLGLSMCMGRKQKKSHHQWDRDLDKDLDRLHDFYSCDVLVTLIRHHEMHVLKVPNFIDEVVKRGIESVHFPIIDKWIPASMNNVIKLVSTILDLLARGKTIVIHCNGGKGRSGTIAVACLVAMGNKVSDAIETVRKTRPGTIRNPMQIIFVKRFKTSYKSYSKKNLHEDPIPESQNAISTNNQTKISPHRPSDGNEEHTMAVSLDSSSEDEMDSNDYSCPDHQ